MVRGSLVPVVIRFADSGLWFACSCYIVSLIVVCGSLVPVVIADCGNVITDIITIKKKKQGNT